MNCNDENRLQRIICGIGIGTWNVCKAVCFEVVYGQFWHAAFVIIKSFFYLLFLSGNGCYVF